jgi:hypothetical protein
VKQDRLLISGERAAADANGVHELLDRVLPDRLLRKNGNRVQNNQYEERGDIG